MNILEVRKRKEERELERSGRLLTIDFDEGPYLHRLRTTYGPTCPRLADVYSALAEMNGFSLFLFILSAMCTDWLPSTRGRSPPEPPFSISKNLVSSFKRYLRICLLRSVLFKIPWKISKCVRFLRFIDPSNLSSRIFRFSIISSRLYNSRCA